MTDLTYGEVWKTLSNIDVQSQVKKKGELSYLSWSWAWGILMENYPQASYEFAPPKYFPDKTCEIWATVKIESLQRRMWLPVMNYKGQPLVDPTARQISDTRMRALTKAIAMFGLGHYIYAGEDLPPITPAKEKTISGENVDPEKVQKAYEWVVDKIRAIDSENEAEIAPKIQETWGKMTPDEQLAVNNLLRDVKEGRKQYNTILKELLQWMPVETLPEQMK